VWVPWLQQAACRVLCATVLLVTTCLCPVLFKAPKPRAALDPACPCPLQLRRAAAQALGLLAEVEGQRFARRLPDLLPAAAEILRVQCAFTTLSEVEVEGATGEEEELASCPRWQEGYACLLMVEKAGTQAGLQQEAWVQGGAAKRLWAACTELLLHRHLWVRKAAVRVLGLGLAGGAVSEALLGQVEGGAGGLALRLYMQLEAEVTDEALCLQAVKCLVYVASRLHQQQPPPQEDVAAAANGSAAVAAAAGGVGEGEEQEAGDADGFEEQQEEQQDEDEEGSEEEQEQQDDGDGDGDGSGKVAAITFKGLITRMAKLADEQRYARLQPRLAALKFMAALATSLGAAAVAPYLRHMLRPLYRITEPSAAGRATPEEVRELGEQVLAHLRELVGADTLLAAYNAAREGVKKVRGERKQKAALRAMVDPEAAAKRRLANSARKAVGKARKIEEARRAKSARTYGGGVKKKHGKGGRGGRGR
jgi:U3 small nucleolar RNA-associated protein 20